MVFVTCKHFTFSVAPFKGFSIFFFSLLIVIPLLKLNVIIVDLCFDFSASKKVRFEYFMASFAEKKFSGCILKQVTYSA